MHIDVVHADEGEGNEDDEGEGDGGHGGAASGRQQEQPGDKPRTSAPSHVTAKKAAGKALASRADTGMQPAANNGTRVKQQARGRPGRFSKNPYVDKILRTKHPPPPQRKKHRLRPGTKSLREIRWAQKAWDLLLQPTPFRRLVKEVAQNFKSDVRVNAKMLNALQEAVERELISTFADGNLCAIHAGRVTLQPRDIQLAQALRHSNSAGVERSQPRSASENGN